MILAYLITHPGSRNYATYPAVTLSDSALTKSSVTAA